jgi:hypothetical protein
MDVQKKSLFISKHAAKRMKERGITREQVESAIKSPTNSAAGNTDYTTRLERDFPPAKRLGVIVEELAGCIKLVTAFWI